MAAITAVTMANRMEATMQSLMEVITKNRMVLMMAMVKINSSF